MILTLLSLITLLLGCQQKYVRPYFEYEKQLFSPVTLPAGREITHYSSKSNTLVIGKPLDKVWDTCIQLAVQSGGILAADSSSQEQKRLVFVSNEPITYLPETLQKFAGHIDRDYIEIWQSIVVTKLTENTTKIVSWWINPNSGLLYDFSIKSEDDEILFYDNIATRAINSFLYAVKNQLSITETLRKFTRKAVQKQRGDYLNLIQNESGEPWQKYAVDFGNHQSLNLRSRMYILNTKGSDKVIYHIVEDLARVMEINHNTIKIYIVADAFSKNAFILSNGEIFVTTSMLDALQNSDQLAGLLAHELDHYNQMDVMRGIHKRFDSANLKFNAFAIGLTLPALYGIIDDPDAWFSTDQDKLNSSEALKSRGLVLFGAIAGAGFALYSGAEVGELIASEYSKDQELRADHNATLYLHKAGYDYRAWKNFLMELSESNF